MRKLDVNMMIRLNLTPIEEEIILGSKTKGKAAAFMKVLSEDRFEVRGVPHISAFSVAAYNRAYDTNFKMEDIHIFE